MNIKLNTNYSKVVVLFFILLGGLSSQALVAGHGGGGMGGGGMGGGGGGSSVPSLDATNTSFMVRQITRTMSDGNSLPFWVYCQMGGNCGLPSPLLEMHYSDTANVNLNMMMAPQEDPPYHGHTIHFHGLDTPQSEDGVPETGAAVLGDNYSFSVDSRYVGSHMYHCHVHTVKHLEMGMYGAFLIRGDGNEINRGGPTYDYSWPLVLSTVDPRYHTAEGDSTVFADYVPRYFLINGEEGRNQNSPAQTLLATPGAKVAIHLIGIHSVNSTFRIRNANGNNVQFVIHNKDGFKLPNPQTVSSLEVSPGQTADIMITLPSGSGSLYPQITYSDVRQNRAFSNGTVYTRVDF